MAMLPRTATTPCSVCSFVIAGVSDAEQPSLCESCWTCVSALHKGLEEAAGGGVREKDAALAMYLLAPVACDALADAPSWRGLLSIQSDKGGSGGLQKDDDLRAKLRQLIHAAFEGAECIDFEATPSTKTRPEATVGGERYTWNCHFSGVQLKLSEDGTRWPRRPGEYPSTRAFCRVRHPTRV